MKFSFLDSLRASFSKRSKWLRSFGSSPAAQKPYVKNRVKLQVEALEDRLVPASLVVNTPLDLLNAPGSPYCSLRDAVNQANLDGARGIGDDITFAPSMNGAHILLQQGHLELKAGASVGIWTTNIYTPGVGLQITLNGDRGNIFQIDQGARLGLHELTLAGGDANDYTGPNGGAINNAGTLWLNFCSFVNNSATGRGGAIYNTGTLSMPYACTFTGNSAQLGGAVDNAAGGTMSVFGTFSSNSASGLGGDGGAIDNDGVMTVAGTLRGNSALNGGAIYNNGFITVAYCVLSGNTAQDNGGGAYNDAGGTMTVSMCTLANNRAPAGGAISNGGVMTVTGSTVSGNSALYGGGIATQNLLTLVDTIVAGNTLTSPSGADPDIHGSVTAASTYNLIGDGSGQTGIGNGINGNHIGSISSPIDPLLAPPGSDGTMALLPGSPALHAGGSVTTLTAGIDAQTTVIPVANAAAIASTARETGVQIDGELCWVTNVDLANNTLTVTPRGGALGGWSNPTSHNAGAGVYLAYGWRPLSAPPSIGANQSTLVAGPVQLTVTSLLDPATPTAGTLRYAVNQANSDAARGSSDTIVFSTTGAIALQQGHLELKAGTGTITITGGGQITLTSATANNVFQVDSGASAVLTGLTIQDGWVTSGNGGGIHNDGTLTLNNATLYHNTTLGGIGGGIYNSGSLTMNAVTIYDNSDLGGSSSTGGGGIANTGTLIMTNSTLADNYSFGSGGGLSNSGTATLSDCTVATNLSGNSKTNPGSGGGLYNTSVLTLNDTTVSANTAGHGAGIASTGMLTLTNSIVAANTLQFNGIDQDVAGAATGAYNLIGIGTPDLTGVANGTNHNQVGTGAPINPLLAPLGSYGGPTQTMALLPGSPALGSGEAVAGLTTDQRGLALASPPDIGAYQTAMVASIVVTASSAATADTSFNVTITALDASGQTVNSYTGPATLTSSDGQTVTPATVLLTNGTVTVPVTLLTPNTVKLTATAGTVKGTSGKIVVDPATPVSFKLEADTTTPIAGRAFTVWITALDAAGHTCLGDQATISLTASDGQNLIGLTNSAVKLKDGMANPTITLHKADALSLVATQGSTTSTPLSIQVEAGTPDTITVSAKSSVTAGTPFTLTVTAFDTYHNQASLGPASLGPPFSSITVTSSDGQNVSQTPFAISSTDDAVMTDTVTLDYIENYPVTLSVVCTGNGTNVPSLPKATSGSITVKPGVANQFAIAAPSTVVVGTPFNLTITAQDIKGNTVNDYQGSVALTCDGYSVSPTTFSFPSGAAVATGTVTLQSVVAYPVGVTITAGASSLTASGGWITGNSLPITVTPDWYSYNISDPALQVLARTDFNRDGAITYDDMLGLFTLAETEVETTNNTGPLLDLQTLVDNGASPNVNMPAYVQSLATQVVHADPTDVSSLAAYYNSPAICWTVSLGSALHGVFTLAVAGHNTGLLPFNAQASDVQSALENLSSVGVGKVIVSSPNPGVYTVAFSDQSITLKGDGTLLNGGGFAITAGTGPILLGSASDIQVVAINGQPTFGQNNGPEGVSMASEYRALVNQWFLGTVHPDDATAATQTGFVGSPTPYSTPAGPLTLFGPSGVPLVTDVHQAGIGDCGLLASLAEVAYNNPSFIQRLFIPNDNGTYTVVLLHNGAWEYVTVDTQLPNGGSLYANVINGVLWVALAEKAFAQAYGDTYQSLVGSNPTLDLNEITGQSTYGDSYSDENDVANALNQNQFVVLGTGSSTASVLLAHHYWAVLSYPSTDQFLIYNPWGIASLTQLSADIVNPSATTFGVDSVAGIAAGDVIQIDWEQMLVTYVDSTNQTLQVQRGYNGTGPGVYHGTTPVELAFSKGDPFQGSPIPVSPGAGTYALFTANGDFLDNNFDSWSETTSAPTGSRTGNATVPAANLGTGVASAASAGNGLGDALGVSLSTGNPPALLPVSQLPSLDPAQGIAQQPEDAFALVNRAAQADALFSALGTQDEAPGQESLHAATEHRDLLFALDDPGFQFGNVF